jgi:hypothetical protein
MKTVDDIYFDICGFLHTDDVREITLSFDGKELIISQSKVGSSGLWIVLGGGLSEILGENHKDFYSMFFGVLLTALHNHDTSIPIHGICLGDIYHSADNSRGGSGLKRLAENIAAGMYQPHRLI